MVASAAPLLLFCARQIEATDGTPVVRAATAASAPSMGVIGGDVDVESIAAAKEVEHRGRAASGSAGGASNAAPSQSTHAVDEHSPLVVVRRWDDSRYLLTPERPDGGFDEEDLEQAKQAWARYKTGETTDIHPRLLEIIYAAARHFGVPYVVVTSGYRPERKSSLHSWGRAADIHLPGVSCKELGEHLRTYGFVGVGVYPRTGGVHVDVRPESYFWVSWEPRGKRWRERGILFDLAKAMDREANARGVEPPEPLPLAGIAAREIASRRRKTTKRRSSGRGATSKRKGTSPRASSRAAATSSQ
jgi:uncharacterized protein YcbK (DUF882 family)